MRLHRARIEPTPVGALTTAQISILDAIKGAQGKKVFRTVARSVDALNPFMAWASYVLSTRNSLSARQREIVVLRVGFLCKSGYEWAQHVLIGRDAGLTESEIADIKSGSVSSWAGDDQVLLQASDELFNHQFVSARTWGRLRETFSEVQCMDVIFTAGTYVLVSMFLNSAGVQLEEGQTLDPDLDARTSEAGAE
ncbi:carboxymuconolactone decarboxylase family protein [Mycobacteroides abscessus]|uniref:carboxymuconolactone decarboxylase family protein n=1 Tax=Mycobacteroides abscessus TaxID=36809 RepID=UPI000D3E65F0|nr:carboxymuconolactone decarboxylase family protein [Mycobacteroides abscessus]